MSHYLRFDSVSSVTTTPHGLLAQLHGEWLRVDVVRRDVPSHQDQPRGAFDDTPTFAVCIDPLADPAAFEAERDEVTQVVRLRTDALA